MSMTLLYTSNAAFEAYVPGWVTDSSAALTKLLIRAQRDIDAILGPIPRSQTTGLKLDPSTLRDWEAEALSNAVCAQAEFRLAVGEDTLAAGRATSQEQGPDFKVMYSDAAAKGAPAPRYGQKVSIELEPIRHLRRLSAMVRS